METNSTWSQLLKNELKENYQWPDISCKKSANKINSETKPISSEFINTKPTTEAVIKDSYNPNTDTRTREEIKEERIKRRAIKETEKKLQNYEQQLKELKSSKSDKIKIIDQITMEKLQQKSKANLSHPNNNKVGKRIQQFQINFSDLIVDGKKNGKNSENAKFSRNNVQITATAPTTEIKLNKGKKREIPKKKWVNSLKKSILLSRDLRNRVELEIVAEDFAAISINNTKSDDKVILSEPLENPILSTSNTSDLKFTRKFRSYCTNFLLPELCQLTEALLRDIFRFQDRAYQRNEIKARATRRFVVGFKETRRQLLIHKIKLLVIAPDLEQSEEPNGIYDTINGFKKQCDDTLIPYVFSLDRWKLGHILLKKVPVACVGIMSYEGSEETTKRLLALIESERKRFAIAANTKGLLGESWQQI